MNRIRFLVCVAIIVAIVVAGNPAFTFADEAREPIRRIGIDSQQGMSAAVAVSGRSLLHTSQLLPSVTVEQPAAAELPEQFAQLLEHLDRILKHAKADRQDVLKLNFYVANPDVFEFVRSQLERQFGKTTLPAVSYVQSALPVAGMQVALDAVIAVNPVSAEMPRQILIDGLGLRENQASYSLAPHGDLVYVAGQAEKGTLATATAETLQSLLRTLQHLGLKRENILAVKCFLNPMSDVATVNGEIATFFDDSKIPPVTHVEWVAGSLPIEIELVAFAPSENSTDSIQIFTPPWMQSSPVYSRIARLFGDEVIFVSGLYSSKEGDGETQVRDIFMKMEQTLAEAGSDLRHLAKATYYVSDDDASAKLNSIRPEVYDPQRPPSASKAAVKGVGMPGRGITIDMIAAPKRPANGTK